MTHLRDRLRAERGIALPIALAVLFVVAGLAAVAARGAITANHQSLRDSNVKRAIQAANAGIDAATYQLNLMQPLTSECVTRATSGGTLSTQAVPSGGWCAAQTEDLGGNAGYTFQVSGSSNLAFNSNGQVVTQRSIVSTGTVNGVLRRAFVRVSAPGGNPIFPKGYAVVSLNSVTYGNTVTITGKLGSNGSITLQNSVTVNGDAHPGVGQTITQNSATVTGSKAPATETWALAPVNQRSAPTVNNNGRIGTTDPWTSPGDISWNSTTRVLSLSKSATLTLSGDVYSFCRISMSQNSVIKIAARAANQLPLRIYMDTPENCGGGAGMGSVSLSNGATFLNLNSSPATFALLVSGSATKATSVDFGQTTGTGVQTVMGIYAPWSTVTLSNSVDLLGAVVGQQVQLSNSVKVTYDPLIEQLVEDPLFVYKRTEYLECTNVATTTTPDSGC